MIDEKKIEAAAKHYAEENSMFIEDQMGDMYDGIEELSDAYKAGVKWAINEFLKNLWNPASEIPTKPNASILAKAIYDIEEDTPLKYPFYYITYTPPCDMFSKKPSEEWNKRSSIIGISDWLYIDDLFPKKGGKE